MTIEALIARYGMAALFLGAGLEGETVVIAGGVIAHRGLIPLAAAMAAAAAGSFVADQAFFAIGRHFRDHPRVRRIRDRPAFARALAMLERHPIGFIFAFRFIYGLRTVSPFAIGASAVSLRLFLLLNALAAILWGIAFTLIGYVFGHAVEQFLGRIIAAHHVLICTAIIAALAGAISLMSWRRRS
jgi:membrane protein DedA with SNARE-associated domain